MSDGNRIQEARLVWNVTTATAATANSGALTNIPYADAYAWLIDIGAGTGTSPTLDFSIQISPDNGTTYYTVSRCAQITTAATKLYKTHCNGPITGQAAAVTTVADTGGAIESNFAVTPTMRLLATIGGTNPSYATIKVWVFPIYYRSGRKAG